MIYTLKDDPGLVTQAERDQKVINDANQAILDNEDRIAFLADQRKPGHLSAELLRVIGTIQDPKRMPVYIQGFACHPDGDGFQIEILGYAEPVARTASDVILQRFQQSLRDSYPIISGITPLPVSVKDNTQPFHYLVRIEG